MDKNSLIQDIKNDLNSIKKQVEITLAKLAVLESMIELDNKLGISVQTSGEQSSLELSRVQPEITSGASNEELGVKEPVQESRGNACIVREPEPVAAPVAEPVAVSVAEPVEAPVEELGVRSEELGVEKLEPVAEPAPKLIEVPVEIAKVASIEEQKIEPKLDKESEKEDVKEEIIPNSSLLTPHCEAQVLRNLMSVISLGDKFRFRHDLFSDSNDLFKETIEILNTIEEFDEAVSYLQGKFNWDAEDATVVYFYDIIRPKF